VKRNLAARIIRIHSISQPGEVNVTMNMKCALSAGALGRRV